jgi:hypothetical protein
MAALPMHRAQLAVLAEPAAALVDRGDDPVGRSLGCAQTIAPRCRHLHRGAHDRVASDSHVDHLDLPTPPSLIASIGQVATARRA